ncbi:hypothetical protein V498_03007 [Pseudogymnoascus sp. VKM F-4517 (FW-2822)]|nr:hypothetical protein V498_03007 [Pseudogymnoascus sp. VKM F-4517 (FW-2822)]
MSDQCESASKPGSSDRSSKQIPTLFLNEAFQAIGDIFIPYFKPDVLVGRSREIAQALMEKLKPIFQQATQSLFFSECAILLTARQAFNPASWGLHLFAIGQNRDYQQMATMATMYSVKDTYLDAAGFNSSFDELKNKLEVIIEPLGHAQGYTFEVVRTLPGLTIQLNTNEEVASYLLNQTWLFCNACIQESDFGRPLLRVWFINEGAQHIETCITMLQYAVDELDANTAFKMMAIIYCGFKIQDGTVLGPSTIPARKGDYRQPQKNRRAFMKCIDDIRRLEGFFKRSSHVIILGMNFAQRSLSDGSVPSTSPPLDSDLPATTNVQELGGSNTSKLLPPLKPKKRMSDDDLNRGTRIKRSKEKKPTPQVLCDETKPELDSGKDNPDDDARFSLAMADYQERLQPLLSGNSPGNNSFSDDSSSPSSPAIADVDFHLVLDPPPPEQVQVGDVIPIMARSTCDPAQNKGVHAIATLLSHTGEELHGKLLGETIRHGRPIDSTTTEFSFDVAIPYTGKYRVRISARCSHVDSEEITVTERRLIAMHLEQLPFRTIPWTIPCALYSGRSLKILHKLWGARLCAGMEDEDVQDALKKVHAKMPNEHHELLCRGAWYFEANDMRILSSPWQEFFRFAFRKEPTKEPTKRPKKGPKTGEYYIFDEIARNWNSESKTGREIAFAWQHMFFAIGESLKLQLQQMNYCLCSCNISQPHSVTTLQKSLQLLHDSEKNEAEIRVARAVSVCTALIVLDFIIEEGGEESEHTHKGSHHAVRSAIQGIKTAGRLSHKNQYDLSDIIAYLSKKLILDMPKEEAIGGEDLRTVPESAPHLPSSLITTVILPSSSTETPYAYLPDKSFGISLMKPERGQGNNMTIPGLPLSQSSPTFDGKYTEDEDDSFDIDAYSTGSFEKYRIIYPPLYIEYHKECALQISRDGKHSELLADRAKLEDQKNLRQKVGLELQKEDQKDIERLSGLIQSLNTEMEISSHKIDQLKAECQKQGIDLDDNYSDNACEDAEDCLPAPASTPPSRLAGLSLIANNLSTPLDDASQDHITIWLFDKFTASNTEYDLFATILSVTEIEPSLVPLHNIRSLWDRDGAGLAPPLRQGALDGSTIRRLQCVTREIVGNGYDRALVQSLFGLSLWWGGTCTRDGEHLSDSTGYGDTEPGMTPLTLTPAIGLEKSLSWPRSQGPSPQGEALPDSRRAASCSGMGLHSSSGQTLPRNLEPLSLLGGIQIQKQNRAEKIYADLVLQETRCIAAIEKAQLAKEPELNNGQDLVNLHMGLLTTHHEFFLASQDSSATHEVQRLPIKHKMGERLWQHAIYSVLELLWNGPGASFDYMLAFIYFAYSMMTLFLETVPTFEDTWCEHLGKIGEYMMVIEHDNVIEREVWARVVRQWYLKSSNRSPITGHLYHHLGKQAHPDALQQLLYYGKSLAVPNPFTKASESIMTLFKPMLNPVPSNLSLPTVITAIMRSHAIVFTGQSLDTFDETLREIKSTLDGHISEKQRYCLAISNCIALLGYGATDNPLAVLLKPQSSNSSNIMPDPDSTAPSKFTAARRLFIQAVEIHLFRIGDTNILSFLHVTLVFMYHLARHPPAASLIFPHFPWKNLVSNLNALAVLHPLNFAAIESPNLPNADSGVHSPRIETQLPIEQLDIAGQHDDSAPAEDIFRPFPEEWAMQGLSFTEGYFPEGWFTNENVEPETHYLETEIIRSQHRPERVLWLGVKIARSAGEWMGYAGAEEGRRVLFRLA